MQTLLGPLIVFSTKISIIEIDNCCFFCFLILIQFILYFYLKIIHNFLLLLFCNQFIIVNFHIVCLFCVCCWILFCIHVLFVTFRVCFSLKLFYSFFNVVKKENCRGFPYNVFIKFSNYVCVFLIKKDQKNIFFNKKRNK